MQKKVVYPNKNKNKGVSTAQQCFKSPVANMPPTLTEHSALFSVELGHNGQGMSQAQLP